ncbi:MAG TPA: hypothetical protein ENN55_05545 [Firmicutes bacterium]|nr:hypothetical protein [Bacillota bacterium]
MSSGRTVIILLLGIVLGVNALLVYKTLETDKEIKKIRSFADVDKIRENRMMFVDFEKTIAGMAESIKNNTGRIDGAEKNIEDLAKGSKAYFELFAAEKQQIIKISSELEKLKKEIESIKEKSVPVSVPSPVIGAEADSET